MDDTRASRDTEERRSIAVCLDLPRIFVSLECAAQRFIYFDVALSPKRRRGRIFRVLSHEFHSLTLFAIRRRLDIFFLLVLLCLSLCFSLHRNDSVALQCSGTPFEGTATRKISCAMSSVAQNPRSSFLTNSVKKSTSVVEQVTLR